MIGIHELAIEMRRLQWLVAFVLFNLTLAKTGFRPSELQFSTKSNVTVPTVIFTQVNLEQCWEECTARVACRAFNYYNLYKLCELDILGDLTNASTSRPAFAQNGVLHWTKQNFPNTLTCGSNTCNLGERCDQNTGACETKECGPLIVSDEIVVRGNVNRIGSYIRLDCKEGYIPSFTKNTVECINTGNWTEHEMTCECEAGWTKFKTSCYQYFDSQRLWDYAKSACEDDNAQLVSITSQEEYNFVQSYIQAANVGAIWIGANDRGVEGSWTWISGEKWDYERFAVGEPTGGKNKNCLIMRNNSGWEDIGGKTNRFRYMCERKV